jgi:16S rRNA (uracil1498-N3)-methyltransferase
MPHERRVFSAVPLESELFQVDAEQTHYICSVLRLRRGDSLVVVDPIRSREYFGELVGIGPFAQIRIVGETHRSLSPAVVTTVFAALCKGKANEIIVDQATELGVERILFWQADHSVTRLESEAERAQRASRLRKIAEAACRQCGRLSIPNLIISEDLASGLSELQRSAPPKSTRICCSLSSKAIPLAQLSESKSPLTIAVGPEGDFTPREEDVMQENGFVFVNLGPLRLRAETALTVGIGMLTGYVLSKNQSL